MKFIGLSLSCPKCWEIETYEIEVDEGGLVDDIMLCEHCDAMIQIEPEQAMKALQLQERIDATTNPNDTDNP